MNIRRNTMMMGMLVIRAAQRTARWNEVVGVFDVVMNNSSTLLGKNKQNYAGGEENHPHRKAYLKSRPLAMAQ
jgi:hypothetical protein